MVRFARCLLPAFCLAALSVSLPAQSEKTVTLRMLDGKTGVLIASSNFLVRVNHLEAVHADWVKQNEDGSGNLPLPAHADVLSVHATYESATQVYVNCDADKDHGSADHSPATDKWYSVQTILTSGVVAPNDCVGKKVPDRLQVIARPGEFVFFVRKLNAREQMRE